MIKRVERAEAEVFPLPGRDWFFYIGPQNSPAHNVSVGVSVFPGGSKPYGHVHDTQEETIYVTSGRGRLVTPEATADLEPGVAVFIPVGTFHATESDGPEPLELVCLFSPPVVPGSYEKKTEFMSEPAVTVTLAPPGPGTMVDAAEIARLEEIARQIRVEVVRAVNHAKGGHLGGPLSAADMLAVLYFRMLRIRPDEPDWPDRDRFVLSKGHSSVGLYAAMALRGYFPVEEMVTFDGIDSRLQGHPDMTRLPGLDMSTGSLGMGISAGMGMALGARLTGRDVRTWVMLGDGECQEGEVWEAAFAAARYGLDTLIAIVDHNKLQQFGWRGASSDDRIPPEAPGELVAKWSAFGWRVIEVDGHDIGKVIAAFETAAQGDGRPTVVIANTVKGRGVSFMEGRYYWHTRILRPEEYARAMADLGEPLPDSEGAPR